MLGVQLLEEREDRVEHDHPHDRRTQDGGTADRRQDCGSGQKEGQGMGELGGQLTWPPASGPRDQLVRPVSHKTPCCFAGCQPFGG